MTISLQSSIALYPRHLGTPSAESFFLLGPRGTGKSTWLHDKVADAIYIDLLETSAPTRQAGIRDQMSTHHNGKVILDRIEKAPEILYEIQELYKSEEKQFILAGASKRHLRKAEWYTALEAKPTRFLYPLTIQELGSSFNLPTYLQYGGLPGIFHTDSPDTYLDNYVQTFLNEDIHQAGLTRDRDAFAHFLEVASHYQGQVLNISKIGRECTIERKVIEHHLGVLEDLFFSYRVAVFSKQAKRKLGVHPKFYFFDVGVYQTLRPTQPLEPKRAINEAALETLLLQELLAANAYSNLGYSIRYWRTLTGLEVDFVLDGEKGVRAFDIKLTDKIRKEDFKGMRAFLKDYPHAKAYFVYLGEKVHHEDGITVLPIMDCLQQLLELLQTF